MVQRQGPPLRSLIYDKAIEAYARVVALDDAGVLEQLDRAIDGTDRDLRVDLHRAAVEFLDIGVVGGFLENPRDDTTLFRHAHAALDAQFLQRFGCFAHDQNVPARATLMTEATIEDRAA